MEGDVFLGERVIAFRIIAHDPRQLEKYKDRWNEHEGTDPRWTYSEVDEEETMFKHRFGKHPHIDVILSSIPVVDADKIPKSNGNAEKETFKIHYTSDFEKEGSDDPDYDPEDYDSDGYRTAVLVPDDFSANETEAIILENPKDLTLLQALHEFGTIATKKQDPRSTTYVGGDITAKWNRETRSGVSRLSCIDHLCKTFCSLNSLFCDARHSLYASSCSLACLHLPIQRIKAASRTFLDLGSTSFRSPCQI